MLEAVEGDIRTECNCLTTVCQGTAPRGPELLTYESLFGHANDLNVSRELLSTRSTADDLARWLQCSQSSIKTASECRAQEFLFHMIKRDSWEVLRLMELTLVEISHEMLDDSMLHGRLQHWRFMIDKIERELHCLHENLNEFARSSNSKLTPQEVDHISPDSTSLSDVEGRIAKIQELATKTHKSLIANVAIMESKRAIASSENIAKITELSFVFIPLTFSASVFSMQVRELKDAHASLLSFFLLASGLVLALYGLRLMIRSSSIITLLDKCRNQVRADAKLQQGASIPTRSFVIWVGRNAGLILLYVAVLISPVVPGLVLLWRKIHNNHLNAFITIVVLSDILVMARFLGKVLFYSDSRGIHLRYSLFPLQVLRNNPEEISSLTAIAFRQKRRTAHPLKSACSVVLINLACIPLGFLWAQPLPIGSKLVITIVIVPIVVSCVYCLPFGMVKPSPEECQAIRKTLRAANSNT